VLYIPAAPPQRGRGGVVIAGIVGAAIALIAVAVVKLSGDAKPAAPAQPQPIKKELVYVQVPAPQANPGPAPQASPANEPARPASAEPGRPARAEPAPIRAPEATPQRASQITVPYRGQDARTQRILVPVTVNGSSTVMMALDTGAPTTLISHQLADHLGVLRSDDGKLLTSASGIGGSAPAVLLVLDSLALGDACEEFVPATVAGALSENFEGLLGMDFITTFKLKIDSDRQVLILTKPESNANTPAGHAEPWWRRLFQQFKEQRKRWEGFREHIDRRLADSQISEGRDIDNLRRLRAIADSQVQEAVKLQNRLERHASNNAVPREWR
jgi:hypothetical protein